MTAVRENLLSSPPEGANPCDERPMDLMAFVPRFTTDVHSLLSHRLFSLSYEKRPTFELQLSWISRTKETMKKWDEMDSGISVEEKSGPVACDGGCGRRVPSQSVVQFGECDHNVCFSCLEKAEGKKMYDGTPACCNPKCINTCSSSLSMSCSSASQTFVIGMRILVFSLEQGEVVRRHKVIEVSSNISLADLKKKLATIAPDFERSQVYYSKKNLFRRKDLRRLSFEEMDERSLQTLSDNDETLTVVVTRPGVTIAI